MEKNHYDVILTSKKSIYFVNSKLTHMKTHTHMLIKFVFKGKKIYLHFLNDPSTWWNTGEFTLCHVSLDPPVLLYMSMSMSLT